MIEDAGTANNPESRRARLRWRQVLSAQYALEEDYTYLEEHYASVGVTRKHDENQ